MNVSVDDLSLVQLGHRDIDPSVLTGPGATLEESLGQRGSLAGLGSLADELPHDGWRLIAESGDVDSSRTFAAPHPAQPNAWALVNITETPNGWRTSTDPGPVVALPGRPARRKGLRLDWPTQPFTGSPAALPELTVSIRNTTTQSWENVGGDSAHIQAWLLDAAGQRLPASPFVLHGALPRLPDLAAGEGAPLPVTIASPEDIPEPGRYGVQAVAVALNLWSGIGAVALI
jgi:hypothetical protein